MSKHIAILTSGGDTPSLDAAIRSIGLLASRLGTATTEMVAKGVSGVMMAIRGGEVVPVPPEEVAGGGSVVPLDHPWIEAARSLGVGLGLGPCV